MGRLTLTPNVPYFDVCIFTIFIPCGSSNLEDPIPIPNPKSYLIILN